MRKVVHIGVPQYSEAERRALITRRHHMQKRSRRMPRESKAELAAIVAASDVPIQKLPPGAHTGWKPSWMD